MIVSDMRTSKLGRLVEVWRFYSSLGAKTISTTRALTFLVELHDLAEFRLYLGRLCAAATRCRPMDPLSNLEAVHAAQLFLHHQQVLATVRARSPAADVEDIHDAFLKAIMQIAKEPGRHDPQKGELVNFLVAATLSRLRDTRRSHEARQCREQKKGQMLVAEGQ